MEHFCALFEALDATTSTNAKRDAMRAYFETAPPADAAWAVWFLSGQRLKRFAGHAQLGRWLADATGLPDWLVRECRAEVGDTAETVALLLAADGATVAPRPLADWMEHELLPLREADEDTLRARITGWWRTLPPLQVFVLTKLMTGALRVGVSRTLVARALAAASGLPHTTILHRLSGDWTPSAAFFEALVAPGETQVDASQPYPFFLAHALEREVAELGTPDDWAAEWKWDGIRAQLVRRGGDAFVWSRGEDLVTERFPEVAGAMAKLPDGSVLDGELLAWGADGVLPFAELQKRIGRKKLSKTILARVPVRFLAYDCLEDEGEDLRGLPWQSRRERMDALLKRAAAPALGRSDEVAFDDWQALAALREEARDRGVEGFMLKRRDAAYGVGRSKGGWWKWKVDPLTVDAVLTYAQPGSGRRSTLLTDYTFALWREGDLVTVAKAYSGLTDEEIAELDRWLRAHTVERFGPVRRVEPEQVFELEFDDVQRSSRHKSGVALRFPRMARWRRDLSPRDADAVSELLGLADRKT